MMHFRPFRQLFAFVFAMTFVAFSDGVCAFSQTVPTLLVNYPNGFTGATGFQLNGSATYKDGAIQLTDGGQFEAGSFFTTARVGTSSFTTTFDFQLTAATADGFAFVMQGTGPNALGSTGGGLGYGNSPDGTGPQIVNSVALVFDLHNNEGEGGNSIRFENSGLTTPVTSHDLTGYGLDLHSGHRFHVVLDGSRVYITDTVTGVTANIPLFEAFYPTGLGYIGFTGSTGAGTTTQQILNWTYTANTPTSGGVPIQYLISYPSDFSGATGLTFNGGAAISGQALQLTHGTQFEATSVFATKPVTEPAIYNGFVVDFDFSLGDGSGDGFTFVLQDDSPTAVGSIGGGLGYGPEAPDIVERNIPHSQAVKFDLHNNEGEGVNSTGLYLDGASPTIPSIDMTSSGINLHNGHRFHANITYLNAALEIVVTDLDQYKVFNRQLHEASSPLTIGSSVYMGFTAGTGATPSSIQIRNWTVQLFYPNLP